MNKSISVAFLCFLTYSICAQEYYYSITTKVITNGDNQRFFVKSELSPSLLASAVEANKMVVFDQTYAYMLASDKFEKIVIWDDLFSGSLIVKGESIILIQTLVGNPETHKSATRVFGDKRKKPPVPDHDKDEQIQNDAPGTK